MADKTEYLPYAPAPDPDAGPRPLHAILADLARPIHTDYLQEKRKGGQQITFVSWHGVTRILDLYAPGWQSRTHTSLSLDGQHVAVDLDLGIPTSDYGMVWRSSTGSDEDEEKAYGDATDRAESQALRRAASKFRLGLYLYYEKGANGPTQRNPQSTQAAQTQQQARSAPDPRIVAAVENWRRALAEKGIVEKEAQDAWAKQRSRGRGLKTLTVEDWDVLTATAMALPNPTSGPTRHWQQPTATDAAFAEATGRP